MNAGVLGAVITASIAVLVAAATQISTWRRAHDERTYDRRRTALLDVQDASLQYRDALRAYGEQIRTSSTLAHPQPTDLPDPDGRVLAITPDSELREKASGRLEIYGVRIDPTSSGIAVSSALGEWRSSAEEHFISPNDETAGAEQAAWDDLHLRVAEALRE